MRILGDLNGPENQEPDDSSRWTAAGKNGNGKEENSSHPAGGEPARSDGPGVEPRDQAGPRAQEPEKGRNNAFAGGIPLAEPSPHHAAGGPFGEHSNDRFGEQRFEPEDAINARPQLSPRHSNGGPWFALMVLTLAAIGATAYCYLGLRENNLTLSQLPGLLQSITTLGGRMNATESKLRDLATNWDGLTNRLAVLDRKVDSRLRESGEQTRALVAQAADHLQTELDQQGRVVDNRLSTVESNQRQDREQLAQLNGQLRDQVASLREQLSAAQTGTGRDLANLQEQVSEGQGNLRTLAQQLHREKVTFEIVKDSPTELAPGVTLTILKTDPSYQRFRGYISLTNEGKTLWLNNLGAKEAVDLYSQHDSHPYSLIVTTVNTQGVVGYLLLPAGASRGVLFHFWWCAEISWVSVRKASGCQEPASGGM